MVSQMTSPDYWIGPHTVRILNSIDRVVALDGHNFLYKNGNSTKKHSTVPVPTKETYREMYAELASDGNYYWRIDNYWYGPYDIRVPKNITWIIARDGYNTVHSDGTQTERELVDSEPTEEQYKEMYATLHPNGSYYWKQP